MASNVLGKQDWGWDERDILEIICNTQAEHVSIAQAAEANQLQETLVGSAEQPRDKHHARRGADTHHSVTERRSAPRIRYAWQISGRWKQGDSNSMLNIRTLHIKKGPLQSLVLAQRWAPEHKECSTQVKSVKTVFSPDRWLFFI